MYRRAVLALGTSVVLFVLGWLGTDLQYFGVIDSDGAYVVSFTVLTVAAALHFAAIWLFVQDFLQFDAGDVSIRADDVEGGFADDAE